MMKIARNPSPSMGEGKGGGEKSVPFPLTSILSHQGRGGIFQVIPIKGSLGVILEIGDSLLLGA